MDRLTKLRLINADTATPVPGFDPLIDGAVVNVTEIGTRNLSVEAVGDDSSSTTRLVRFSLIWIRFHDSESRMVLLGHCVETLAHFRTRPALPFSRMVRRTTASRPRPLPARVRLVGVPGGIIACQFGLALWTTALRTRQNLLTR